MTTQEPGLPLRVGRRETNEWEETEHHKPLMQLLRQLTQRARKSFSRKSNARSFITRNRTDRPGR